MERPAPGRVAGVGRDDRRLVTAVEPEERAVGGWGAAVVALGDRPGGVRAGGVRLHRRGFEYDWNGVIIGRDLVWRGDRWVAQREFNKDPDFRNRTAVDDATFDRLVRHVYKVLLTRGMIGTLIYSPDEETREMLQRLVIPH